MKIIKSLIPYIIIIVAVVLIRTYIVTPVRVNGSSMYDTLKGNEIMLLNKLGKIDRFDIVVLKTDLEHDNLIKRVIALPGETIEIIHNEIYINGKKLEEKYGFYSNAEYEMNTEKITLATDEYYCLGDNREISLDSRVFGPVKKSSIKGTTNFIIFPFKSFGKVEK